METGTPRAQATVIACLAASAKAISISGKDRLVGKKILDVSVGKALRDPKGTIDQATALLKI